ncbi:GP46-like surface antigen, putative, partial [Bodo saltans]
MFECSDAKKKREYKSETMKWQAKFVFGWTVVLHCLWMSCEASTKQSERSALILFYNATNGPHWKNTPWPITDSGADYCSGWNGVRCNAQGRLQRLSLGYEDLIGAFPNEAFAEFEQLEELDLAGNKLSGTVSSNLCASGAYLRKLNLNHNLLVGPLPSCVSSWTSLTEFKVTGNSFSGSLDSKWGSSWQSLREFSIDSNSFSGTLPESFSHWTNLTTFVIELNDLTGTVPDAYGRSWTQVTVVSLSWNYLTGTLPPSFSNAKNMKEFVFYRNDFASTLPPEYGSWGSTMIHFEGSNNPKLHGSFPSSYGAWTGMEVFKFTECALTGSIPPEYHTWHNVANFSVWKNNINGTLPSSFSNWKNIQDLTPATTSLKVHCPRNGRLGA